MKYFFAIGGGLGDAILTYVDSDPMSRLTDIHAQNPQDEFTVFSKVHNDGVNELFYHHPAISQHVQINMLPQANYHGMPNYMVPPGYHPINDYPNCQSYRKDEPVFNLSDSETRLLNSIFDCAEKEHKSVTVISPFAGMPVRDAFDNRSLNALLQMIPGYKVIIGKNHLRGELPTDHRPEVFIPFRDYRGDVINLIDEVGIRFTWHLIKRCHAFVGGHSCAILLAWEHNRPNVCCMSDFITIDGANGLDRKYLRGRDREETFMPVFKSEHFDTLDLVSVADHLKRYL